MTDELPTPETDRVLEEIPASDDAVSVVLHGHLLVSEILERIVAARLPRPEHLSEAALGSYRLVQLARAAVPREIEVDQRVWDALGALNGLRNLLVHERRPPELEAEVARYLELWPPRADGGGEADGAAAAGSSGDDEGGRWAALRVSVARLAVTLAALEDTVDRHARE